MSDDIDALGPIDFVLLEFPDQDPTGETAAGFVGAAVKAGGQLVATARIPAQEIIAALDELGGLS
jgi:hypothetical protein